MKHLEFPLVILMAFCVLEFAINGVTAKENKETPLQKTCKQVKVLEYKVAELERKMLGVQKQVNVLHSKKTDK